jgi:DNA-binding LacI/PurR family transcriptional regulator
MADVARLAGVSVSTVSYALTGTRSISAPTRERIERAMLELGYTPNVFARGLKSKRSRIIALLFPTRVSGLRLSSLEYILGASDHAQEQGYHLLLWTKEADELDGLAQLAGQGLVDGALMMEVRLTDPRIQVLRDAGVTFVMIGRTEDSSGIDFTDTNFEQCAELAVEHLVGQGHQHLGLLNLAVSVLEEGRGNAVRIQAALRAAADRVRVQLTVELCPSSIDGGRKAYAELVQRDPQLSAVIAFNEQAVPGLMAAAADGGRRIPLDLSVLSVDMPSHAAEMTTPPMSTVGPSAAEMGRAAVDLLLRRLEGDGGPPGQVLFRGELQVRGSSGPVRLGDRADGVAT